MKIPKSIRNLVEAFERLPGIGPKTAQRLTFYLLHVPQEELELFASSISNLKLGTKICSVCKNVGESDPCEICTDMDREHSVIAVVETPLDVMALEKANFKGLYHVLHGVISPLNNIGPDDLYIHDLIKRLKKGRGETTLGGGITVDSDFGSELGLGLKLESPAIKEIILATNTNLEGESTAMYISKLITEAKDEVGDIKITRIGRGLPVGGDIVYADDITLKRALEGRVNF